MFVSEILPLDKPLPVQMENGKANPTLKRDVRTFGGNSLDPSVSLLYFVKAGLHLACCYACDVGESFIKFCTGFLVHGHTSFLWF